VTGELVLAHRIVARNEALSFGGLAVPNEFVLAVTRLAGEGRFADEADEGQARDLVKSSLTGCLTMGLKGALQSVIDKVGELRGVDIPWAKVVRQVLAHIWDKINLRKMAVGLVSVARKKGWKFGLIAVLLEIFEDIVLPGLAIILGAPGLVPLFLAVHLEPIVYPIALCMLGAGT